MDGEEQLGYRTEQKAYLMRYGRQDWFSWENRGVDELDEACSALVKVMQKEKEANEEGLPNLENL